MSERGRFNLVYFDLLLLLMFGKWEHCVYEIILSEAMKTGFYL